MISPSVPYLRLEMSAKNEPVAATFIAFFKCELNDDRGPGLTVVQDPGAFALSSTAKGALHRLVRVSFIQGLQGHQRHAASDTAVLAEEEYDWSLVPGGILGSETAAQSVKRVHELWVNTGICPDPGMYEVQRSKWLVDLGRDPSQWCHYILVGHDDYVEVIARGWAWSPGQVVA